MNAHESGPESESPDQAAQREGERIMSRTDGPAISREVAAGGEDGTIDIGGAEVWHFQQTSTLCDRRGTVA